MKCSTITSVCSYCKFRQSLQCTISGARGTAAPYPVFVVLTGHLADVFAQITAAVLTFHAFPLFASVPFAQSFSPCFYALRHIREFATLRSCATHRFKLK